MLCFGYQRDFAFHCVLCVLCGKEISIRAAAFYGAFLGYGLHLLFATRQEL